MATPGEIGVGLLGLGVVGTGVAQALLDENRLARRNSGCSVKLKKVLVKDATKRRSGQVSADLITTDPQDILENPDIHVLVEVMGGECPATTYIQRALSRGMHVVTANKEVMAKHGPRLLALSASNKVNLLFEASVGGGIPIIGPLRKDLLANEISSIHAIINGTTNYIVSRMARDDIGFDAALKEAQHKGYAESDPTEDIEGTDAAYKLAVLASLAFHTRVEVQDVYREGISRLQPQDFRYAHELGYAIKLLAIAKRMGGTIQVRVHPAFVPMEHMLAKVDGAFNAVEIEGDLIGRVLFHGMGAGREPTTSAVIGDVVQVAQMIGSGTAPVPSPDFTESLHVVPMSSLESKYYLRLNVADRAGVLAEIAKVLGDRGISIASVLQKGADKGTQTAEIVVTTHPANEQAMQDSLERIKGLEVVREISNLVRVEDWSTG